MTRRKRRRSARAWGVLIDTTFPLTTVFVDNEADYRRLGRRYVRAGGLPPLHVNPGANASVRWSEEDGVAMVGINRERLTDCSVPFIVATCAHEATHVFDHLAARIGETNPSMEFRAYMVGRLTRFLFECCCGVA